MEIINENYILIILEFDEKNKISVNEFRSILMGNNKEIEKLRQKRKTFEVHNIPSEINKDFIENVKNNYNEILDKEMKYFYPIDFSIIKRVVHTFEINERKRYINKPPGCITLYKYIGPLTYIKDFLKLLRERLIYWNKNQHDVLYKIRNLNIILGSESKYIQNIVNQNYFLILFEFCSEKADPNDFRRALLGLKRITKNKSERKEIDFKPNVPLFINNYFRKIIEQKYHEELDPKSKYLYPIDFAIVKRPVIHETENDSTKYDSAAGVVLLYKYMGPLIYIYDFKEIFQKIFINLRNLSSNEKDMIDLKNTYFNKANEPLIVIGSELKYYKGF